MNKFVLLILAIMLIASCRDSTIIGTDLLDDDKINLDYKDDYVITTSTVKGDSILMYAKNPADATDVLDISTFLLGGVEDPIFGTYTSEIYVSFQEYVDYDFVDAEFDSIVLSMYYEPLGFIGDTLAPQEVNVYSLTEDFVSLDTIFSDQSFMSSTTSLGSKSFLPKPNTDLAVFNPVADSIQSRIPQLRVRLDDDFGKSIMADSLLSEEMFLDKYKGLKVQANSNGKSMMAFNLSDANNENNTAANSLELFYTNANGEKAVAYFVFRQETTSYFTQDYSGTPVSDFLNNNLTDSLTFVQSMNGVLTQVVLPDVTDLSQDVLINHAQLIFYQATIPGDFDPEVYPAIDGYYPLIINSDGERQLIDDLSKGIDVLDGALDSETINGEEIGVIKFNITDYIQELAEGNRSNILEIVPLSRSGLAKRSIIYGSEHSVYKPVLKISYTNI